MSPSILAYEDDANFRRSAILEAGVLRQDLTPKSTKFYRFLQLILLEHKPLLACFGFMTSQKWLVSRIINLRERWNLIDVGAEDGVLHLARGVEIATTLDHQRVCRGTSLIINSLPLGPYSRTVMTGSWTGPPRHGLRV